MLRVLVFDVTTAAISVGKYIEKELMVEVKKVVGDDCHSVEDVAKEISSYMGRVDVVVLAGPLLAAKCGQYLEKRFPAQKFIFFGADLPKVVAENEKVLILTPKSLRATDYYQRQKARCQEQEIEELDCERWLEIMRDCNLRRSNMIADEIKGRIGAKLIVNCSELMAMYDELEKAIDWRMNLVDLRKGIVAELKKYQEMKEEANRQVLISQNVRY